MKIESILFTPIQVGIDPEIRVHLLQQMFQPPGNLLCRPQRINLI
ncbi:MAG: hypothetical protein PVF66_08515 [Candidatus Aminicenantes bacterium]